MPERTYDLEDRLLNYAAAIITLVDGLPATRAGNHVGGQLLRSGTSPLPNHGEAQAAESRADFLLKMQICLKELRESRRWLKLIQRSPQLQQAAGADLIGETEQLIRIFFAAVRTARQNDESANRPAKGADAAWGKVAVPLPSRRRTTVTKRPDDPVPG